LNLTRHEIELILEWYSSHFADTAYMTGEELDLKDRLMQALNSWSLDNAETTPDQPEAQAEAPPVEARILKE